MKLSITLAAVAILAVFAVATTHSAAPQAAVDSAMAVPAKPYRYRVAIRVRETADEDSFELTSVSLPLVKEGVPGTVQLESGELSLAVQATVSRERQDEIATVEVTIMRAKKVVASPTVQVVLGRTGRIRVGNDAEAISVEIVPTGRLNTARSGAGEAVGAGER
ncbi:MAG: hypothetical protein U0795_24995 [Pirellulales bacterium]